MGAGVITGVGAGVDGAGEGKAVGRAEGANIDTTDGSGLGGAW